MYRKSHIFFEHTPIDTNESSLGVVLGKLFQKKKSNPNASTLACTFDSDVLYLINFLSTFLLELKL